MARQSPKALKPEKAARRNLPRQSATKSTEAQVLLDCKRRCCLCYYLGGDKSPRKGQVAHLNRERSDSRPDNLVFLCFEHHDEYDSQTSQSKNLTPLEVRHYRDLLRNELWTEASTSAQYLEHDEEQRFSRSQKLVAEYNTNFALTYAPIAEHFVSFECLSFNGRMPFSDVLEVVTSGSNVLLKGPSGIGKTLASFRIGLHSMGCNYVPVVIYSKDFIDDFDELADSETRLLGFDFDALMEACKLSGVRPIFIIDGYNECSEAKIDRLVRSAGAVIKHHNGLGVLTSQTDCGFEELLDLRIFQCLPLSMENKRLIAQNASSIDPLPDGVESMLSAVASGLEARIIGEVSAQLPRGVSRYGTFDAYVRAFLGSDASTAVRLLSDFAFLLCERLSYSLSFRDLDRSGNAIVHQLNLFQKLERIKILDIKRGRISFGHELYLSAFGAEAVIRRARENASTVIKALSLPIHAARKGLILGAIDDTDLLCSVTESISDSTLLAECLDGQCGATARLVAENRCKAAIVRMREEIEACSFRLKKGEDDHVEVETLGSCCRTHFSCHCSNVFTV